MKRQEFKGEITAFLSLIFVLLLSLAGALIQSASIHITKSMKRADTELALESVFAEYDQDMFEEYDLFVKIGTDETTISRRLWFYGAKNMEHKIQKIQLLSDGNGQVLYGQIILAMGGKATSDSLSGETNSGADKSENMGTDFGANMEMDLDGTQEQVSGELQTILQQEGQTLSVEDNPIETVNQLKKSSLLSLIHPNPESISNRAVQMEDLASQRSLQKGTGYDNESLESGVTQKALLAAYIVEHFPNHAKQEEGEALLYQQEYLLGGCSSDMENLEAVAKKILAIRMAANYTYLLTDETRQAEAEAMAVGLCSLMTVPGASVVVKQAILLAWAYGESVLDMRSLFDGKKVPLVKADETWQSQLTNLVKLGTTEEVSEQKEFSEGLDYSDYIKTLLFAENEEALCMRTLDLLELNLGICVDECVTALEIKSTCEMQRGIKDTFVTDFEYK
ncbi:MAG: hypothetical protein IJ439_07415 [Tyzzerella sp.]|nr:hypothetical protein [Tyzzerella sp.]